MKELKAANYFHKKALSCMFNRILQSKSMVWFLYDRDPRHERVKYTSRTYNMQNMPSLHNPVNVDTNN